MKFLLLIIYLVINLAHASWENDSFETRINDRLAIRAIKCRGDEVTASPFMGDWYQFLCGPDEWLMVVDNVNTCENGYCTEEAVAPIMVKLRKTAETLFGDSYYAIKPSIPVDAETRWILRRLQVHFSPTGEAEVVTSR